MNIFDKSFKRLLQGKQGSLVDTFNLIGLPLVKLQIRETNLATPLVLSIQYRERMHSN